MNWFYATKILTEVFGNLFFGSNDMLLRLWNNLLVTVVSERDNARGQYGLHADQWIKYLRGKLVATKSILENDGWQNLLNKKIKSRNGRFNIFCNGEIID